jgi:hypothetical protein
VTSNDSFYADENSKRGRKDVIVELVFSRYFPLKVVESISIAKIHPNFKQ